MKISSLTLHVGVVIILGSIIPLVSALTASSPTPHFFLCGLGYCGSRLAVRLRKEFPTCQIAGSVRSEESRSRQRQDLHDAHVRVHVLDLDQNYIGLDHLGREDLSRATHIVQTVAPIADLDRDPLLALHLDTLKESKDLLWVGYLSSTGVYGDHHGDWVDEESELRCQDAKSLARVKAEMEWRQLEQEKNLRVDCFRCGGIYGPGRGPLFSATATNSDTPSTSPSDALPKYVNRILVDDICSAMVAAVKSSMSEPMGKQGAIYNLVDDDPAPRQDVMKEAQRLLGITTNENKEVATGTAATKSTTRRPISRSTGNKRCRNQRLKNDFPEYMELRVAPTYREGLAYLHQQPLVENLQK